MSRASSPSTARRYGTARVCQLWEVPRSTVYERRARASRPVQPAAKRGPKQAWTDAALTERIRAVLTNSPFLGEGYRKAWARLRLAGVRTSKGRVLRLMREAGLLAPTRVGRRRGPRSHDGTITTERPDEMWGTDATACLTTREGNATVFIAVDHCTQECVGIHAGQCAPDAGWSFPMTRRCVRRPSSALVSMSPGRSPPRWCARHASRAQADLDRPARRHACHLQSRVALGALGLPTRWLSALDFGGDLGDQTGIGDCHCETWASLGCCLHAGQATSRPGFNQERRARGGPRRDRVLVLLFVPKTLHKGLDCLRRHPTRRANPDALKAAAAQQVVDACPTYRQPLSYFLGLEQQLLRVAHPYSSSSFTAVRAHCWSAL